MKAMFLFQQQQVQLRQVFDVDRLRRGERMVGMTDEVIDVLEQDHGFQPADGMRKSHEQGVQLSRSQSLHERSGLVFAPAQFEFGIVPAK